MDQLFVRIVDPVICEAKRFCWRCPLWQGWIYHTAKRPQFSCDSVLAFPTGQLEPLMKVAARSALLAVTKGTVDKVAHLARLAGGRH